MKAGLGVRPELFAPIEELKPELEFLEAHSENYFGESLARAKLLNIRQDYAVSLHGVGLSLGRADNLNQTHLKELKDLVSEVEPIYVSEHLAWSAYSHRHVPDLLPLPLTDLALQLMCEHVDKMQSVLQRQILVENPSNYLLFDQLQIPEPEFLNELAQRTGCGLLLDVNNVHVSAANVGRDPRDYIAELNSDYIGQYHLAGYTEVDREVAGITETLLIDTHNQPVHLPVWELFDAVLTRHGARPTLIEWDSDFPDFQVLLDECSKASLRLENHARVDLAWVPKLAKIGHVEQTLGGDQSAFLDAVFSLQATLDTAIEQHKHRLWVYQNNVFAALQDYFKDIYPATCGVVGDAFFKQMVQRYVQGEPPSEGNIYLYGANFSTVIESFEGLQSLTYLADLARYEWAIHAAYFAAVSDSFEPSSIAQEQLLTADIVMNNSAQLFQSQFPLYEIHRQSLPDFEGEVNIDLSQSQDELLVCKVANTVITKVLNSEQASFISALKSCANLLQAIESLQGSISEEALSSALSLVFECKLLVLSSTKQVA